MKLPLVISIPHCGAMMPDEIGPSLAIDRRQISESVDFGTEEIFGNLSAYKILKAQWSRLTVDLNRAPDQTDGKGVTALTDYHGRPIYRSGQEPDGDTIAMQVKRYHRPYHDALENALATPQVIGLIDGHSLNGIGPRDAPDPGQPRKDIILSNNGDKEGLPRTGFGPTSCTPEQMRLFKHCFEDQGFSVSLNSPYQGGYIVNHYGQLLAKTGRFAIQIEMNQDLYMTSDKVTVDPQPIKTVGQLVSNALEKISAVLIQGDVS